MPSPYTPQRRFPATVDLPDDSDPPDASDVNTGPEGALDRTEWLKAHRAEIATNFRALVSTGAVIRRGNFSLVDQTWYAVGEGGTDALVQSLDGGATWADLSGSLGSGLAIEDVVFDTSGNSVIVSGTRDVYVGTRGGWDNTTFAVHTNAIGHTPAADSIRVGWDSVAAKFVVVYRNGTSGQVAEESADGVTWTAAATLPPEWSTYAGTSNPRLVSVAGVSIAAFVDSDAGRHLEIMVSTDGGVNWTNVEKTLDASLTTSLAAVQIAYDEDSEAWYVLATDAAGSHFEVFKSTDHGVSWTSWVVRSGLHAVGLVALPTMLVILLSDGRVIVSLDDGSSWWFATALAQTTPTTLYMRTGGGQIIVWNQADHAAWATFRDPNHWRSI